MNKTPEESELRALRLLQKAISKRVDALIDEPPNDDDRDWYAIESAFEEWWLL